MFARLHLLPKNKTTTAVLVAILIFGGIRTQASGVLNSQSVGHLVGVDSRTKVVTPGTSRCPKGSKKLVLGAQGAAGAIELTGAAGLPGKDGVDGEVGKTI